MEWQKDNRAGRRSPVDVRFHQMKDTAFRELIRLRGHAVLHKPVGIRV